MTNIWLCGGPQVSKATLLLSSLCFPPTCSWLLDVGKMIARMQISWKRAPSNNPYFSMLSRKVGSGTSGGDRSSSSMLLFGLVPQRPKRATKAQFKKQNNICRIFITTHVVYSDMCFWISHVATGQTCRAERFSFVKEKLTRRGGGASVVFVAI